MPPYTTALSAAGAAVYARLANGACPSLSGYDGLVLMGGTDVSPGLYNQMPHPQTDEPDPERDEIESLLLLDAIEKDLPVLAICRGMQLMNVAHGGTLIQHLDTVDRHRKITADRGAPAHTVDIAPGTRLAAIAKTGRWSVNSRHHQAVSQPGKNLTVSAVDSEDGTIEAMERADRRFVVGVQWHPEDRAHGTSRSWRCLKPLRPNCSLENS